MKEIKADVNIVLRECNTIHVKKPKLYFLGEKNRFRERKKSDIHPLWGRGTFPVGENFNLVQDDTFLASEKVSS